MKYRYAVPALPHLRYVHSHHMLRLLGVRKLPRDGMPVSMLPGADSNDAPVSIKTWVVPLVGEAPFNASGRYRMKRSAHRVRCECPGCGAELSAGRLFQHICKPGSDRALESVRASLGFVPHAPTYTCDCAECRAARASASNPHGYVSRKEYD